MKANQRFAHHLRDACERMNCARMPPRTAIGVRAWNPFFLLALMPPIRIANYTPLFNLRLNPAPAVQGAFPGNRQMPSGMKRTSIFPVPAFL